MVLGKQEEQDLPNVFWREHGGEKIGRQKDGMRYQEWATAMGPVLMGLPYVAPW